MKIRMRIFEKQVVQVFFRHSPYVVISPAPSGHVVLMFMARPRSPLRFG